MKQWDEGDLQLTVASTKEKVIMIEAGANEIPEDQTISYPEIHTYSIDGNICSPGCGNTYGGTNYDTCGSGSARMGTNTADVRGYRQSQQP